MMNYKEKLRYFCIYFGAVDVAHIDLPDAKEATIAPLDQDMLTILLSGEDAFEFHQPKMLLRSWNDMKAEDIVGWQVFSKQNPIAEKYIAEVLEDFQKTGINALEFPEYLPQKAFEGTDYFISRGFDVFDLATNHPEIAQIIA